MGFRSSRGLSSNDELAVYRDFVRRLTETCEAAARGDLEARVQPIPEAAGGPELASVHHAVNRVLDVSDAFVRESSAALTADLADQTGHATEQVTAQVEQIREA
jgi:hypothetical protein